MSAAAHRFVEKAVHELLHALHRESEHHLGKELAEIVGVHAVTGAAAGVAAGWVPGVGGTAAMAVAAGAIWTMYGRINAKLGVPFSENLVKSVATAVATNLGSYFVANVVMTSVFSMFPGIGSVAASGVQGVTGYALTVASGVVYFKVLTELARLDPSFAGATAEDLKAAAERAIARNDMKAVIDAAKSDYSRQKR
jgi:hypothetical protein